MKSQRKITALKFLIKLICVFLFIYPFNSTSAHSETVSCENAVKSQTTVQKIKFDYLNKNQLIKHGASIKDLKGFLTEDEINEFYKISQLWEEQDFVLKSYTDLIEQLPPYMVHKILKMTQAISEELNRIDDPVKIYGPEAKQLSMRLTSIIIRNEKGRQVNAEFGRKEEVDGHIHSVGWITGSLALLGVGSWLEMDGEKQFAKTHQLALFSSQNRANWKNNKSLATRHGTPVLNKDEPRLLLLFEFQIVLPGSSFDVFKEPRD